MKKRGWTLFCVLFLLLAALPALLTPILGFSPPGANETLAAKPRLTSGGHWNWDFLKQEADYLNDRYALRQELITGYNALLCGVFHQSAAQDVTLGKEDTLLYTPALEDYAGKNAMDDRALFCAARNLALLQEACNLQGARFLFTVAPNKASILPRWVPELYRKGIDNRALLEEALLQQGVSFCDLFSTLQNRETLTYYRQDSHWNGYGSALACDVIMQALGRESSLASEEFSLQAHAGDLYEMLFPASEKKETAPALARERTFSYAEPIRGEDDLKITTVCPEKEGTALIFRDSFGNNLHKDLAEQFAEACFLRAMPYDLTMAEQLQPDYVLVELVERNLHWLAWKLPILPAPRRELEGPMQPSGVTADVALGESSLEGCVLYEGRLAGEVSSDARIFVVADGIAYEACISPEGFCAHAPAADSVEVCLQEGQELYALSLRTQKS